LFVLFFCSEDYENEKIYIFDEKKFFLKKLKTEDFFGDRKTQSSKLIFDMTL
jgi:hypothetical protein